MSKSCLHRSWVYHVGKQSWHTVKLPSQLYERIKRVLPWLGIQSVAEYVRSALKSQLRGDELFAENMEERAEREREESEM